MLPLAAFGLLNPIVVAATMTLSSVFVVWNSLHLRRFSASSVSVPRLGTLMWPMAPSQLLAPSWAVSIG